jgi:hypothetical protein
LMIQNHTVTSGTLLNDPRSRVTASDLVVSLTIPDRIDTLLSNC